jgi:bacillithiol biosynthesis cysteine-adding enzyme BshC
MTDGTEAQPGAQASLIGVDVGRLGWIRPLVGEYASNFAHVAPLYAGDPRSPEAWRHMIARTQQRPRRRGEIAEVVAAQQARRGAPPESRAAAARLADPQTVAILTGQQAGAFGGPLFTLLKALTTLQLARRARAEYQVAVVPVFWVDAEDHDWEEVRSCTVLDAEFRPRTITLDSPDGAGELPVTSLMLDSHIEHSIAELAAALPATDFTDWVVLGVRSAYRPGVGIADAFARWLEALLGPYGLVVFESADPAAKPLAAEVFAKELRAPGRTAALATTAGEALSAKGHQPQVVSQPDSLSLFHLDGGRRSIRRQGDEFLIGEIRRTVASLADEAATEPGRFSPNVLLRPIVQDTLFPTVCYVAGPSELAYLGQLGGVYEQFGLPMPLIHPRASATLVDSATTRFLTRYDVPLDELQRQDESALNRLLQSQLPPEIEQTLKEADEAIRRALQRVIEALPALDATLAGAAKTTRGKMEHDLRALHSKVIQAAKRRDDTLRRQFTRAQAQIFPLGHPQERTLAVVFFLNRYGPALVDRLLEDLPLELGRHWVMAI